MPVIVPAVKSIIAPSHTAELLDTDGAIGNAFTVIVNDMLFPEHPFALGVTVIVDVTGVVPLLIVVELNNASL